MRRTRSKFILYISYNIITKSSSHTTNSSSDNEQREEKPRLELVLRHGHWHECELQPGAGAPETLDQLEERRRSRLVKQPPNERPPLGRRSRVGTCSA